MVPVTSISKLIVLLFFHIIVELILYKLLVFSFCIKIICFSLNVFISLLIVLTDFLSLLARVISFILCLLFLLIEIHMLNKVARLLKFSLERFNKNLYVSIWASRVTNLSNLVALLISLGKL